MPALTRRACLALAASTPVPAAGGEKAPSLAAAAARAGLLYGSDSDSEIGKAPPAYGRLMRRHCALFAPLFQWSLTEPRAGGPAPAWADPNIAFARQAGMRLTGGHFVWHQSVPGWFGEIGSRDAAERAIARHVTALGRAYAGQVFSWNVVNEALDPRAGRADGLRRSVFAERFGGDAFFDAAFHAARAADPAALLVYNEYGLETASPADAARRRVLLALLDRLLARGVPIDAVGLQSHLRLDAAPFDEAAYRRFLAEIASRRLRVLVTELDVLDADRRRAPAARDAEVAAMYARFLAAALDEPATAAIVTWGLSDRYTWLSPEVTPDLDLPPGPPARPLPFDADFRPKPAYGAMMTAFAAAPARAS